MNESTLWYETIEENIRKPVKLLRDNGFNTFCSCHHNRTIDIDLITDGELMRLDNLLYNNNYRNYEINIKLKRDHGVLACCFVTVTFKSEELKEF